MDWLIVLAVIGLASWYLYRKEQPDRLAELVMKKWVELVQIAAAAEGTPDAPALVGRTVSVSDFRYEFVGDPSRLKVSVTGTGAHLGFRADIADSGTGLIWVEEGRRPGARKLQRALCKRYPDLVDGNALGKKTREFVERFADPSAQ